MPKIPDQSEVLSYFDTLSNWGRWGDDDELGTLNLITPEVRVTAARTVESGESVSCAWDLVIGPGGLTRTTFTFDWEAMGATDVRGSGAAEHICMQSFHGAEITHLDSLCHAMWDGTLYNGRPASKMAYLTGTPPSSTVAAKDAMSARGVLLDVAAVRGVDWLERDDAVYPDDLDAAEEAQGVRVEPGDAVLLRTGASRYRHETGEVMGGTAQPGFHAATLPWLHERGVAYIGCDTATEALPSPYPDIFLPVHTVALVAMGLWLIDNCDLEALAATAARLGRWAFHLSVNPLRLPGGTGSPVNPVATF